MAIRGEIVLECDTKDCHAELVIPAAEFTIQWVRDRGVDLSVYAYRWRLTDDGGYVCPQCRDEHHREKHEDDGQEYGHPADRRAGIE